MKRIKFLKDYGCWGKSGKTLETSDSMTLYLERKGIVKVIKDLGKYNESPYFLKQNIISMEQQIKALQKKIRLYKNKLKGKKC